MLCARSTPFFTVTECVGIVWSALLSVCVVCNFGDKFSKVVCMWVVDACTRVVCVMHVWASDPGFWWQGVFSQNNEHVLSYS